eukprot:9343822-Karenia_brevis.AAC.1
MLWTGSTLVLWAQTNSWRPGWMAYPTRWTGLWTPSRRCLTSKCSCRQLAAAPVCRAEGCA